MSVFRRFLGSGASLGLATMGIILLAGCVPEEQSQAEGTGGLTTMIIILVLMFAVFYYLRLRPQRKRQTEHRQMAEELKRGDKVVTVGGICGEIDYVGENHVILEVEGGTKLKLLKSSIMGKQQVESL